MSTFDRKRYIASSDNFVPILRGCLAFAVSMYVVSARIRDGLGGYRLSVRLYENVSVPWRDPCVLCVGERLDIIVSVSLMINNEISEACTNCVVEPFVLLVCLWMEYGCC